MGDTIKILDPVKGLVDYVNDIKPYHTKVIESLVEYVGIEAVDVRVTEEFHLGIELLFTVGNPFCEIYTVGFNGQTIIPTNRQVLTNVKQTTGSPTELVYDFYGTIVRVNGVLQREITTLTPVGDYFISGLNEITFVNPAALPPAPAGIKLNQGDNIDICTGTQEASFLSCDDRGFGAQPFGDPVDILVVPPNPAETVASYPSLTFNSFIVSGDQRLMFDPNNNLTFRLDSFIEYRIVDIIPSIGSTGGKFVVVGDVPLQFLKDQPIAIRGSLNNDGIYIVSADAETPNSPVEPYTIISVDGFDVAAGENGFGEVGGFVARADTDNTGPITIITSTFFQGNTPLIPYTLVTISGLTLIPPLPNSNQDQRYISIISGDGLNYTRVVSYSKALFDNDGSPSSIAHNPDEGVVFTPLVGLSQTNPQYFEINGNYIGSNLEIGDSFDVLNAANNDGTYIINNITLIPEILGSPIIPEKTRFTVDSVDAPTIEENATVRLDIPSNMFFVDGDYRDFFKQGFHASAVTGSAIGDYTVLYASFINGQTRVRVIKDVIQSSDIKVVSVTANSFTVTGTQSSSNPTFNITNSNLNDGVYTVASVIPDIPTDTTTITVLENVYDTDDSGELTWFESGNLRYKNTGFGETPEFCEIIPETMVRVDIKEALSILCELISVGSPPINGSPPTEDLGSPPSVAPCVGEMIDQTYSINISTDIGDQNIIANSQLFASATTGIADTTILEDLTTVKGHIVPILGTKTSDNSIHIEDPNGDIYNNITSTTLGEIDIIGSDAVDNNATYNILSIVQNINVSPNQTVLITKQPINVNTGVFSDSTVLDSGKILYNQWFQYMILNTDDKEIILYGDATKDINPTDDITIFSSNGGLNDGGYTIDSVGKFIALTNTTTIYTVSQIPVNGITGGWVI